MWSPEPGHGRIALALCLAAALLAGGCQVRPLYGPAALGGDTVSAALADVDVAPVAGRVPQRIRNDLLFRMNGGNPGSGAYQVTLDVRERYANVITRSISGLPGGRNVRLIVNYELRKTGDDTVLTAGSVTRIASFDYFNQRFANDRATIDAEDRAAREIATDIQLRLASYFATGKAYSTTVEPLPDAGLPLEGTTIFDDREPTYGAPQ